MMKKALLLAVVTLALPLSMFAVHQFESPRKASSRAAMMAPPLNYTAADSRVSGGVSPAQMSVVTTEPGTLSLLGASLIGAAGLVRRKFRA